MEKKVIIKLDSISKIYEVRKNKKEKDKEKETIKKAVSNFSLEVNEGEFIALLGPSGCGKTTTLRMIAGLEEISTGELELFSNPSNSVRPCDRNLAMVFQDYALIPHKSVYDNIAYPLKVENKKNPNIKSTVEEVMNRVALTEYASKKPSQLSGGQRQRVALARALIKDSPIILMDEPLSNLDAQLRTTARTDIININRNFNKTVIYVTHDQIEAMSMASRIVVMKNGEVQQIGTSKQIYNTPSNEFVAKFIGNPGMNVLDISGENYGIESDIPLSIKKIGIRPEHISLTNDNENANFVGVVTSMEDFGNDLILTVSNDNQSINVRVPNIIDFELNKEYSFKFMIPRIVFFDENGKAIYG